MFEASGRRRFETGLSSELFVSSVEPGSPADRIGIRRGDQFLELDGEPLLHWDVLRERLAAPSEADVPLAWMPPGGTRHDCPSAKRSVASGRLPTGRATPGVRRANRLAWKTDPPVPIPNRFLYALGHAFDAPARSSWR